MSFWPLPRLPAPSKLQQTSSFRTVATVDATFTAFGQYAANASWAEVMRILTQLFRQPSPKLARGEVPLRCGLGNQVQKPTTRTHGRGNALSSGFTSQISASLAEQDATYGS
uniref:Uncharacterized protein n=1 Tax=Chrysotila carterae TaxID=13221 RepID=A0A7S4C360_CHRCT|eukprot:4594746-Pleurochrysis_carterae.AAC.3